MTMTESTTAPELRGLPAVDVAALKARATADADTWLTAQVADLAGKPAADRLSAVSTIDHAESAAKDTAVAHLDAIVHNIVTRYTLRHGVGLAEAVGVNRTGLKKIRDRAARTEQPVIRDAPDKLHDAVVDRAVVAARVSAVQKLRDSLIAAAIRDTNLSNAAIGRLVGRDPSWVSHIKSQLAKSEEKVA